MRRLVLAGLVVGPLATAVLFAGLVELVGKVLIAIEEALTIENGELG